MNFLRSKVLLKKINAIHDSGEAFEGKFSSLEKDLMLQYLRELYECVSDQHQERKSHRPVQEAVTKPEPKIEPKPQRREERYEEKVEPIRAEVFSQAPSTNGLSNQRATIPHASTTTPTLKIQESLSSEFEDLFNEPQAADRSQRFANGPISDIGKAMGINERILTINELFKGDQQSFLDTVSKLNALSSFNEAKSYLANGVAMSNEWTSDKRLKKAKVFVKLVRRKFQS